MPTNDISFKRRLANHVGLEGESDCLKNVGQNKTIKMKKHLNIANFESLSEHELQGTNGGFLLMAAYIVASNVLFGAALYGAIMDGYYDGKAAALGN
jgi:hypothetical protein